MEQEAQAVLAAVDWCSKNDVAATWYADRGKTPHCCVVQNGAGSAKAPTFVEAVLRLIPKGAKRDQGIQKAPCVGTGGQAL